MGTHVRLALKTLLRMIMGGLCVSPATNTRFEETLTHIRGPDRWVRLGDSLQRARGFWVRERSTRK